MIRLRATCSLRVSIHKHEYTATTHFKSSGEFRHASEEESEEDCLTDVTSS